MSQLLLLRALFRRLILDLIKTQTNTVSVEHGCALPGVAFALGAVNLVVFFDPRWSNRGSCYRFTVQVEIIQASERRRNNFKGLKDFYLTTTAIIWPSLSYMCHIRYISFPEKQEKHEWASFSS